MIFSAMLYGFSRSQITITRTTLLFWLGWGMGGLSMNSRSPSKTDEARLLATNPGLVPGGFHLGDDLAVLDAVAAGIGDHGAQRLRALLVGLRHRPTLGGDEREPHPVGGGDLASLGVFAVDGRARLCLLVLVHDRDERPGADDLLPELRVVGPGASGDERQQTKHQDPHGISSGGDF
jgi:hypothetical protein